MKRFVEGADRGQSTLLAEGGEEWVEESNCVRVVDCFVDALDLADLGFEGVEPAATGRPAYHPSALLKLYIYGYLEQLLSCGGLLCRRARSGRSRLRRRRACSDRPACLPPLGSSEALHLRLSQPGAIEPPA